MASLDLASLQLSSLLTREQLAQIITRFLAEAHTVCTSQPSSELRV